MTHTLEWHDLRTHFLADHTVYGGAVGESALGAGGVDVDNPEDVAASHAFDHDADEWAPDTCAPYIRPHTHDKERVVEPVIGLHKDRG